VRLVLRIPGGRPVIALGEVRHYTEQLDREFFGIEFTKVTEPHRAQIEEYIERRLREERGPVKFLPSRRLPPVSGAGES
jgi:hypothetical protein